MFRGRIITASSENVEYPDGRRCVVDVVKHPGGACVLAIDGDGKMILLHQWRPAIGKYLWEIPAGKLEPGENPFSCVQRELAEEAGFEAQSWTKVAEFFTTPGFCDEVLHIYNATDLSPVQKSHEPNEMIEVYKFTREEIDAMLKKGEIEDGKTLIALLHHGLYS